MDVESTLHPPGASTASASPSPDERQWVVEICVPEGLPADMFVEAAMPTVLQTLRVELTQPRRTLSPRSQPDTPGADYTWRVCQTTNGGAKRPNAACRFARAGFDRLTPLHFNPTVTAGSLSSTNHPNDFSNGFTLLPHAI